MKYSSVEYLTSILQRATRDSNLLNLALKYDEQFRTRELVIRSTAQYGTYGRLLEQLSASSMVSQLGTLVSPALEEAIASSSQIMRYATAAAQVSDIYARIVRDTAMASGLSLPPLMAQALVAKSVWDELRVNAERPLIPQGASLLLDGVEAIGRELENGDDRDVVASTLLRLVELFEARFLKSKSKFEADKIIIVLTVLAVLLQAMAMHNSTADTEAVLEAVRSVPAPIVEAIERAVEQQRGIDEDDEPRGIVTRNAHLRAGPLRTAKSLRIVPAFEEVAFVELRDGWAKVAMYDAVLDEVVTGWISARFVRILDGDR